MSAPSAEQAAEVVWQMMSTGAMEHLGARAVSGGLAGAQRLLVRLRGRRADRGEIADFASLDELRRELGDLLAESPDLLDELQAVARAATVTYNAEKMSVTNAHTVTITGTLGFG